MPVIGMAADPPDPQRLLAAELADVRAIAAQTWRPLEEDVTEAADLAAAVLARAADGNRQDLVLTLAGLRETTGRIEQLALTYFDATVRAGQLAAELEDGTGAGPLWAHFRR